jgi:hypothetical protein
MFEYIGEVVANPVGLVFPPTVSPVAGSMSTAMTPPLKGTEPAVASGFHESKEVHAMGAAVAPTAKLRTAAKTPIEVRTGR